MYSQTILIGNLGQDVELKYTGSGMAVANFSLATSSNKKINGKYESKTEWHNIVTWDKLAENASKFLQKGSKVLITGQIENRTWDDSEGKKHYKTEIVARELKFLESKPVNMSVNNPAVKPISETVANTNFTTDEIPF